MVGVAALICYRFSPSKSCLRILFFSFLYSFSFYYSLCFCYLVKGVSPSCYYFYYYYFFYFCYLAFYFACCLAFCSFFQFIRNLFGLVSSSFSSYSGSVSSDSEVCSKMDRSVDSSENSKGLLGISSSEYSCQSNLLAIFCSASSLMKLFCFLTNFSRKGRRGLSAQVDSVAIQMVNRDRIRIDIEIAFFILFLFLLFIYYYYCGICFFKKYILSICYVN